MRGVLARPFGGDCRVVAGFLAEVDPWSRHTPVVQARFAVLLVELAIGRVSRVSVVGRPHLFASLLVPREHGDVRLSDEVRAKCRAVVGGAVVLHWHHALRKLIGFWVGANHAPGSLAPRFPAGHEVRFYKKHADAGFLKVVFEAGP